MNKTSTKVLKIVVLSMIVVIIGVFALWQGFSKSPEKKQNNLAKKNTAGKAVSKSTIKTIKNRNFSGDIIYNNSSIPVLMYHSIDYEKGNELRIPKDIFEKHMKYLKDNKYTTLTMNEFYSFVKNNKPVPKKSVLITFDDGYRDNYINAYPILKKFDFKATIFVITSTVDKDSHYLSSKEIKEMVDNGIDIESHTVNHDKLEGLSYDDQVKTLKASKQFLEKVMNKKVDYIAYPYGSYNDNTEKAAEACGYKMAFTTQSGWANKNQGIYKLHRVYISLSHDMKEFERRVTNSDYDTSN
jgi:peptidoglycan/xylan/chitin deacetylase (PgdA/CDA1 family)